MNFIYGINAVAEALKARGRAFSWVGVAKERNDLRLQRVIEECRRLGIAVRFLPRPELDRMTGNGAHQGVVRLLRRNSTTIWMMWSQPSVGSIR